MIKKIAFCIGCLLTTTLISQNLFAKDNDEILMSPLKDSLPINAENCFSAQYLDIDISRNILQLVVLKKDKNNIKNNGIVTATGWIVNDSSTVNSPYNSIITARHVIDNGEDIGLVLSDGTYIGTATVSSKTPIDISNKSKRLVMDDVAVLQIKNLNYEGKKRYPQLDGIKISPYQSSGVLKGIFKNPAGIDGGTSGAPILNSKNEAIGVMTNGSPNDSDKKIVKKVDAMNERWNKKTKKFDVVSQSVYLSTGEYAWGDSISSEYIVSFIGNAGNNLSYQDFDGDVTVPGFPNRVCVVYHGKMKTDR